MTERRKIWNDGRAVFWLPIGIPGSGKTTLGLKVVGEDGLVSPDNYRRILTGDENNQEDSAVAFELCKQIATRRLLWKQDVWFDATNLHLKRAQALLDDAKGMNAHTVVVLMDTPELESRRRNTERDRVVPNDVMNRMAINFRTTEYRQLIADDVYRSSIMDHIFE